MESLPIVRGEKDQVIALLVSDLHLSHQKPSIRAEDDWYAVQAGYLKQLSDMVPAWDVPIICAGDVVDRWAQPCEFINWALDHLPEMWTVAGQHDLPNHLESEIHRSAFWTLVKFGKLRVLKDIPQSFGWHWGDGTEPSRLFVYGYGWGKEFRQPMTAEDYKTVHLAVVHRYFWVPGKSYPDAPKDGNIREMPLGLLDAYDAILSGDNHKQFLVREEKREWLNPGTFIRRKADEIDHRPCVGLLKADGSIERKFLDVSKDRFVDRPEEAETKELDLDGFVEGLKEMGSRLDFESACKKASEELSKGAKKVLLEALDSNYRQDSGGVAIPQQ